MRQKRNVKEPTEYTAGIPDAGPAARADLRSRLAASAGTGFLKRFAASVCAVVLALSSAMLLLPAAEPGYAETAGETLIVRVQYFGERGDMIREKARFTRSELEGMGAQQYYYSNVTRVGTVMSMAAYGPEVLSIIEAAGIDPGSISNITFRTTDGYTRNFTVQRHLSGGRYYYPELASGYERGEDSETLTPLEGALTGAEEVPAILALEFGESKAEFVHAPDLTMSDKKTYRFCMGQTPLQEGVRTRPGQDGGDVSSMDSVHSIYGMDVTLEGSPVEGIGIDPVDSDQKVGSVTKLQVFIDGDQLFAEDFNKALGKLTWSSSDPSIATVDQDGNVTILKPGTVTITVTAANGMSASVVINGTGKAKKKQKKTTAATKKSSADSRAQKRTAASSATRQSGSSTTALEAPEEKPKVHLRELSLGAEIKETQSPEDNAQRAMSEDTGALKEQREYAPGTAAGAAATAIAACGAGGIHRFRRYRGILKGWKR